MLGRVAQEGEQALAGFLQACRDRPAAELPFGQEGLAPGHDLRGRLGVHHVVEVGLDLVMQVFRGVGQEVALLVDGAALDRHVVPQARERRLEAPAAVGDHQLRLGHATGQQIVEHGSPGGFTLTAHVLDREHHLLAVAADAEGNQERDRGRLAIEPDLDHGAVQDQADDVVAGQITFLPDLPRPSGWSALRAPDGHHGRPGSQRSG